MEKLMQKWCFCRNWSNTGKKYKMNCVLKAESVQRLNEECVNISVLGGRGRGCFSVYKLNKEEKYSFDK